MRGLINAFATAISLGLQYGVPLEDFVRKFCYMRFEPEGITDKPEIPFAKWLPDYIMRWLASRFIEDVETLEELGIMSQEVRAKKEAETSQLESRPRHRHGGSGERHSQPGNGNGGGGGEAGKPVPAAAAMTDSPPVRPAKMSGLDLGPACEQCGGMMLRTGSCYTCSSCGTTPAAADRATRPGNRHGGGCW